jgi:broad specificity phosphatase PhoE
MIGDMRKVSLVRHGATSMNHNDVSVDKIRGWKDVPLSDSGKKEAERLGDEMTDDPPDAIVSSDLKRAYNTAKTISDATGSPIEWVTKNFRPWNAGDLTGTSSKDSVPVMVDYAENHPDDPLPGGESFNSFKSRFFSGLADAMDRYPGHIGVVTHHRGERLMQAWAAAGYPEDGDIDLDTFSQKGEHTGSVTKMMLPQKAVQAVADNLAE